MHLTNQHRAILITFLISGTIVLATFSVGLKKHSEFLSESYFVIEPEPEPEKEELQNPEDLNSSKNTKAETNKAFNEAQESKHFAQAYKRIAPPEDYVPKSNDLSEQGFAEKRDYKIPEDSKLDQEELSKFNKANDVLKQLTGNNNHKSTISFSLPNRSKVYIPIPVYLCEVDGKIVVNVTVNANGNVTDAYINTSSTSSNECLIEHALEYARQSKFSADPSRESQIGSITFNFIGKR